MKTKNYSLFFYCYILLSYGFMMIYPLKTISQNTSLIIRPGATFLLGNNTLVLDNTDITANGLLDASDGNLIFTGTSNSSVTFASAPAIKVFILKKTGGALVTLNSDIGVNDVVDFEGGILELNGKTLNLGNSGTLQNESETSRITGVSGGSVTAAANSVSSPSALNIGNLGADITSAVNLGNVEITRMHKPAQNPDDAGKTGIQRTFLIQPANNTALNATLRFHYLDAELNGKDESTLNLWRSNDGVTWQLADVSAKSAADNYVEATGLSSLAYFTLSDAANPLPVVLSYFKVSCENNNALLEWQTASEYNMAYFEVERSADNISWVSLQSVQAANNSNGASYSYEDKNPPASASYRLKMVDISGDSDFSPVFSGDCFAAAMPFMIYPNPARDNVTARISVRQAAGATIEIFNMAGQQTYSTAWNLSVGVNQITLPVRSFAAGVYIVKVFVNNISYQAKLIKQ